MCKMMFGENDAVLTKDPRDKLLTAETKKRKLLNVFLQLISYEQVQIGP